MLQQKKRRFQDAKFHARILDDALRNKTTDDNFFALSENESKVSLIASVLKERLDMLVKFGDSISQRQDLIDPLKEGKWEEAIKAVARVPVDFEYVLGGYISCS